LDFLPFARPALDEAMIAAISDTLRSRWIASGPQVQAFERALSEYVGGRPVRTLTSATGAMQVALELIGVGRGDEVITPAQSFFATANVIERAGAKTVFVDVELATRNMDLAQAGAAVTQATRALLPTHYNAPIAPGPLAALAKRHQLRVIEDAALAIGSRVDGKPVGGTGDLVSFSFQANKNITCSEGGCLVLNNLDEAKLAEKYRLQGVSRSGLDGIDVDVLGGKYNMTDMMAAIGLGQLPKVDQISAHRRALARRYFEQFGAGFEAATGAQLPVADFENTNWHLFQIILPDNGPTTRADFMAAMAELKIGTGFHYAPIHLFSMYRARGFKEGMFPVAERIGRLTVTLPMFYSMTTADVDRVVAAVQTLLAK